MLCIKTVIYCKATDDLFSSPAWLVLKCLGICDCDNCSFLCCNASHIMQDKLKLFTYLGESYS